MAMFKKLTNRKGFTLIQLMIVVAIIGILAGIAIPQYVKYVKRARTAEGLTHVGQAYNALADWFASPDLGNGTNLTPATIESALGTGGKKFQDHFPSEHEWLVTGGGDKYYTYSFGMTVGPSGGTYPLVMATGRNSDAVFGMTIKSRAGGESSVISVSSHY
jgi:type IV pilus assembly protein PilA